MSVARAEWLDVIGADVLGDSESESDAEQPSVEPVRASASAVSVPKRMATTTAAAMPTTTKTPVRSVSRGRPGSGCQVTPVASNSTTHRNRGIGRERQRRKLIKELGAKVVGKFLSVGKLMLKTQTHNQTQSGTASGVLISDVDFLITRHSLEDGFPLDFAVGFGVTKSGKEPCPLIYDVVGWSEPHCERARTLGLHAGGDSDFIILQLWNSEYRHGAPGKQVPVAPMESFAQAKVPKKLFFVGYTNGSHLKVSSLPGRPLELNLLDDEEFRSIQPTPIDGRLAVRADLTILQVTQNKEEDCTIYAKANPNSTSTIQWSVHRNERDGAITLKYDGRFEEHASFWLRPITASFDDGHLFTSARTDRGSCGGVYFTEQGELYAIHQARILSEQAEAMKYPDHLALLPWTSVKPYSDHPIELEARIDIDQAWKKNYRTQIPCNPCITGAINAEPSGRICLGIFQPPSHLTCLSSHTTHYRHAFHHIIPQTHLVFLWFIGAHCQSLLHPNPRALTAPPSLMHC